MESTHLTATRHSWGGWTADASAAPQRHALVLPRRWVSTDSALLTYPALAAAERGATTQHVQWDGDLVPDADGAARNAWVCDRVAAELDRTITGARGALEPLIIASSLSTRAATVAAERHIPGIWIAPLLRSEPGIAAAIGRSSAPALLVGGTDDPEWDAATAHAVSPYVLEIVNGDHSLMVAGSLSRSAAALARLASAVEEFLDEVVGWGRRPATEREVRRPTAR